MEEWIEEHELTSEKEKKRQRNLLIYRHLKDTLLKEYVGKWILIGKGEFLTSSSLLKDITDKMVELGLEGEPCFVQKIGESRKKRTFGVGRRIQR